MRFLHYRICFSKLMYVTMDKNTIICKCECKIKLQPFKDKYLLRIGSNKT